MPTSYNNKVLVLGIDGMDPRLTRKYVDAGLLPNVKKYIESGACREDLMLLGAQPTVTPPWMTTLATGAYPMTHGITEFFAQSTEKPDVMVYNLDSTKAKLSRSGTALLKPDARRWSGIGLVLLGRHLRTAISSTSSMAPAPARSIWPAVKSIMNLLLEPVKRSKK